MDSPIKPWERRNPNSMHNIPSNVGQSGLTRPRTNVFGDNTRSMGPSVPRRPNRPAGTSLSGAYGPSSYSSGLGSFGGYSSMMSPYSMYGGGGGMYGGYGRMGYGGMSTGVSTNRFVRLAEESSRPAFESLESIVQAVGSIAMVLESTFFAVNSSFRAVIGLADHFTRLKTQFSAIISAFTVIRTLRYLYRKVLYMLGFRKESPVDDAWVEAKAENIVNDLKKNKSSWPVLLFFVIVLGGPYLIWKLLHNFMNSDEVEQWATGDADHFLAEGQFDFEGESDDELSFEAGQKILVAPKELQPQMRDWLLASVTGKVGLIPLNHIRILGKRRGKKQRQQFKEEAHDVWQDVTPKPQAEDTSMTDAQRVPANEAVKDKHVAFWDEVGDSSHQGCDGDGLVDCEFVDRVDDEVETKIAPDKDEPV